MVLMMRPSSARARASRRRAVVGLQRANEARGLHHAKLQGAGEPQEVVPLFGNEFGVDPIAGQRIERAVIGFGIDPPQAGAAGAGRGAPVAELVTRTTTNSELLRTAPELFTHSHQSLRANHRAADSRQRCS